MNFDTEDAYEIGFAHGYGTEPVGETEFSTLTETQAWETGYDAGKQARTNDDAHRARRNAAEDKAIRRALIGMGLPPHEADGTIRDHGFMYRVARDQVRGITHALPDEPVTHCTLCGGVETVPGVCDRH